MASEMIVMRNNAVQSMQRLRLQRFGMSLATYAVVILATVIATHLGLGRMNGAQWATYIGIALFGNVTFFVLFYTNVNLRFSDPSLTREQIVYSALWGMVVLYALPEARPVVLLFYLPAFSFGMLSLTRRQYVVVVACVLGLYAALLGFEFFQHRQGFRLQYEMFLFSLFGILLTWFAFFGGFVSNIRRRLRAQKEEIQNAYEEIKIETENRKQAEVALKETEIAKSELLEKLNAAQHIAKIGSWALNFQTNHVWWSDETYRIFGVTPQDFVPSFEANGKFIHPDDFERYVKLFEHSFQTGEPLDLDIRLIANDGLLKHCNAKAKIISDDSGQQILFIGTIIDITERKQAEAEKAELKAQNQQLQKAESLGRMAGSIAHNFNNQLQVVIGNLEMAMNEKPGGSETLSEALKAAHKAAEVSALMLTYSGKLHGKHEPIDLSATCRQSLVLLQAAAPKGTILNGDFPASGPVIRVNAGQIMQVLTNIITNAWESADENRRSIGLTVKTLSQTDIPAIKRFPIDWKPQESDYACLEVADAGCGIAYKDIENLFDPFYSTKFTGRGMGLSVVLGIVRAHNGGITVESEPSRGSVFRVFLPLSAEEVPSQTDKAAQPSESQEGGTILLIEDEEMVRKMARTMLIHLGYGVLEAKDGAEAMEIFQQHRDEIRCVLSDLTMPHMNGWDTLEALRKLSPDIPVILASGYDEAYVMACEHSERFNAFLGKPYQLKGLSDTISRVLSNSARHRLLSLPNR